MDFADALNALEEGKKVSRPHMYDDGIYCYLNKKVKLQNYPNGVICLVKKEGHIPNEIFFKPNTNDMLAEDWEIYEEPKEAEVKTETKEYYKCPYCGYEQYVKRDEESHVCLSCRKKTILKRKPTFTELTTKKNFGEFPTFRVWIPTPKIDETLKPGEYRIERHTTVPYINII